MPQILSLPNEDIQTSGWSTQAGTSFFAMVAETEGAADDDTTYVETAAVNSALILGFEDPPPPDFGTQGQEMVVRHRVNVNATGNTALVGHSILDYGQLVTSTAVVITSTYSSLSIPLGALLPTPNDYNGVQVKSMVLTAPQTGEVRVTQYFLRTAEPMLQALPYTRVSEQEAINRLIGNGDHAFNKEEALARYLQIPGWYAGKYTWEELVAIWHGFSPSDPIADEHDNIQRITETVAGANDFVNLAPGPFKYHDEQSLLSKRAVYNAANSFLPAFPTPNTFSIPFDLAKYGITPNVGASYFNGTQNSAYKDSGHEFHVGYSAGIFMTASFENTVMVGKLQGGSETYSIEMRPYLASTDFTGQNTILELPGYLRVDYSGSGYNRFVAQIADETNVYVSAVPSDAVTFAANEIINLAFSYAYDGLDAKFYVNDVKSASVSDGDFVGAAIPTTMFVGGNSAKTSSFSGGLRSLRIIDYARI